MKRRSTTRFLLEGLEGTIVLVGAVLLWPLLGRWLKSWGASREERDRQWPGDALVDPARHRYTRAITISAAAGEVWPWVVQIGLDRAGFYSYELLERIAGIPVTNIESVGDDWQSLAIGDELRLHPKVPGPEVAEIEVGRRVCFGAPDPERRDAPPPDPQRSWSIYVEPSGDRSCRLVVRGCIGAMRAPGWGRRLAAALEGPIDFTMEQRMLRTIRRLAESGARCAGER